MREEKTQTELRFSHGIYFFVFIFKLIFVLGGVANVDRFKCKI